MACSPYLLFSICLLLVGSVHCQYSDSAKTLLDYLRANYSIDLRPNETTDIHITLSIFALNGLDIGSEVMSLSSIIINAWTDHRLTWNPLNYNGITELVTNTNYIWKPPLLIENEVEKVTLLGSEGAPLRIFANGLVAWTPPVSSKTTCSVDITYYPYDIQTCSLTIVGWSYTTDEVDLYTDLQSPIATRFFSPNGEWDLLNTGASYVNLTNDGSTFRKINFSVTFRRKWQFYGQNILIPLVLNSLLMAMVFVVPIESGEKMGYCLTVLLSYIVLLTMVSDNLPSISSQTSVIQIYLSGVMCIGTAGTIATIAILRLYNKDENKRVPNSLQIFTRYFVAPFTCVCNSPKSKTTIAPVNEIPEKAGEPKDIEDPPSYNYKEIARMMDSVFFRIFAFLMISSTGVFLIVLHHRY